MPLLCLLLLAAGPTPLVLAAAVLHTALRVGGRPIVYRALGLRAPWSTTWLVPLRDALSFALWMLSFTGSSVRWNGERLRVDREGRLHRGVADERPDSVPIDAEQAARAAGR
jgi:ceramide glucosyltransferase